MIMGVLSAVFALFILPEIFGAAAILLGAYVWRLDFGKPRHIGAWVIILGIVFMLVGLYYTSIIALYDFLP